MSLVQTMIELALPTAAGAEREFLLTLVDSGELTVPIPDDVLKAIESDLLVATTAAESALAKIREASGPNLTPLAGQLFVGISLGAGQQRFCRDVIRALFRQRNAARRQQHEKEAA